MFGPILNQAAQNLSNAAQGAGQAAGAAAEAAGNAAGAAAEAVGNAAGAAAEAAGQAAGAAAEAAGEAVGAAAQAAGAALGTAAGLAADGALLGSRIAEKVIGDGQLLLDTYAPFIGGLHDLANDGISALLGLGYGAVESQELTDLRSRCTEANNGEPVQRKHDSPAEHEDYAMLSDVIYNGDGVEEKKARLAERGYSKVENPEIGPLRDPETGLEAEVWVRENEDGEKVFILVFEGTTSGDNGADWPDNLGNGLGTGVTPQYQQALELTLDFKEAYGDQGDLVVTGHSLGGGLATFGGLGAGVETVTFSPSGLGPGSHAYLDSMGLVDRNEHLVKNYVHRGEILNIVRGGSTYIVGPFAPSLGHLIMVGEVERFGDYRHSSPIDAHNDLDLDL